MVPKSNEHVAAFHVRPGWKLGGLKFLPLLEERSCENEIDLKAESVDVGMEHGGATKPLNRLNWDLLKACSNSRTSQGKRLKKHTLDIVRLYPMSLCHYVLVFNMCCWEAMIFTKPTGSLSVIQGQATDTRRCGLRPWAAIVPWDAKKAKSI